MWFIFFILFILSGSYSYLGHSWFLASCGWLTLWVSGVIYFSVCLLYGFGLFLRKQAYSLKSWSPWVIVCSFSWLLTLSRAERECPGSWVRPLLAWPQWPFTLLRHQSYAWCRFQVDTLKVSTTLGLKINPIICKSPCHPSVLLKSLALYFFHSLNFKCGLCSLLHLLLS